MKFKQLYLPFLLEWRLLWRSELGSPVWKRWRPYIYVLYLLVNLAVIASRLINPSVATDRIGTMCIGFVTTLFIWSSYKSISIITHKTNLFVFSQSPFSKYLHVLLKMSAHWLYYGTVIILLVSPSLMNMIIGGHVHLAISYICLYFLALWVVSIAWILMSGIVYLWGKEVAKFSIKIAGFICSIAATVEIVFYPQEIEQSYRWILNYFQLIPLTSVLILGGGGIFIIAAGWTGLLLHPNRTLSKNAGGGASRMKVDGFAALLIKEYRLFLRMVRKITLFTLFNYLLSFGIAWVLFKHIHPNELYFYVSIMMFVFAIYIAGPSNMLCACEEHVIKVLQTSPTSIKKVILAKTIAVFSILCPVSLVAGFMMLKFTQADSISLWLSLMVGMCIGFVSVWSGAMETTIHLMGLGFSKMMVLSIPSLLGSATLVITVYFIGESKAVIIILLMLVVLANYGYSFMTGLRLLKGR